MPIEGVVIQGPCTYSAQVGSIVADWSLSDINARPTKIVALLSERGVTLCYKE